MSRKGTIGGTAIQFGACRDNQVWSMNCHGEWAPSCAPVCCYLLLCRGAINQAFSPPFTSLISGSARHISPQSRDLHRGCNVFIHSG